MHGSRKQVFFCADNYLIMGYIQSGDIVRTAWAAEIEPPALANRIGRNALMLPDNMTLPIYKIPLAEHRAVFLPQEPLVVIVRNKANILAFRLGKHRQIPFSCQFSRMCFFQICHREKNMRQ